MLRGRESHLDCPERCLLCLEVYLEMYKANGSFWKTSAVRNFAQEIKRRGCLCHPVWPLGTISRVSTATPFLGLSLVSLRGTISPVRLIGFPESRRESKDTQESFPALGDRGPALTQASLPMICFFILTEVGLMQNAEMVLGVRTGIQSLFPSYQVLNYTVMCPFCPGLLW